MRLQGTMRRAAIEWGGIAALALALAALALALAALAPGGSGATAVSAADPGASTSGNDPHRSMPRFPEIVAKRVIGPRGGTVRGGGAGLRVPPRALKRRAWVQITRLSRNRYDFHVFARWKGRVTVNLPRRSRPPLVAHRRGGQWVIEPARVRGQRVALKVNSLSIFTDLWTCARRGPLWLPCLIDKGVRRIPLTFVRKLVGSEYDPCLPPGRGNISLDTVEILISSCTANAPASGDPAPADPAPQEPPPSEPPPPPSEPPPPPSEPPPPPSSSPSPKVSLSKGSSAQGLPGCSSSYCRYMVVSFNNFPGGSHSIRCRASHGDESGFYTYHRSGSSGASAVCYYGFPGRTAWVTVDGVRSNSIVW